MPVTDTAYYQGYDLTDAIIQVDGGSSITEYRLNYPNKVNPSTEKDTYDWRGGGKRRKIELLSAVNLTIDADCVPLALHKLLFNKATITAAAGSGMTASTIVGIGGGDDLAGVSVGIKLIGKAVKVATDGTESVVKLQTWYPVGTLTLANPPAFSAGAIMEKFSYAFSASATLVDINGGAITGETDAQYVYVGEVA